MLATVFAGFLGSLTFPLPQSSTMAPDIDMLYDFIYWVSVILLAVTTAAMLYFAYRYRVGPHNTGETPHIHGNAIFEWTVSVALSILFVVIFVWGLVGFNKIYAPPDGAYEISVIGQQWMWQFQYANGKTTSSDLYVPRGVPVKLIMTSRDVIHDFFVPNFRLKQDVVPGRYTSLWFEAPHAGENQIFCAQYCGTAHSNMIGKIIVLEPEQFKVWLQGGDPNKVDLADMGKNLFMKRNCVACHAVNGPIVKVGPSLAGLFGHKVELADGSTTVADENYIRESITNPAGRITKGFRPIMPTFKGLLSEEDLNALVAYIKSLKE